MGRRLSGNVIVNGEVFGPSDKLPDWAAEAITNPKAWAGDPAPEPVDAEPEKDAGDTEPDDKPAGNASIEAWQDYALAQGKSADDLEGLTRNQIRDLFA